MAVTTNTARQQIFGKSPLGIFISHVSAHKDIAVTVKQYLHAYGVESFVAHEDIAPTKQWQREIERALNAMDVLVALLTKGFHQSLWTDQEIGHAIGRGVLIIPVIVEINPYGFIGKYQGVIFRSYEDDILEVLLSHARTSKPTVDALISAMKKSGSYDESAKIAKALPFIKAITSSQIKRMVNAYNDNSQVYDCFNFNGTHSASYGRGLVHYINKLSKIQYVVGGNNRIKRI